VHRLLALDVDGTLLDPTGQLRPAVRAALARVRAAGVTVVLATGRRLRSLQPLLADLDFAGALILNNGAVVLEVPGPRLLARRPLPRALAREAVEIIWTQGCQPLVYEGVPGEDRIFTGPSDRDSPLTARYLAVRGLAGLVRWPDSRWLLPGDPVEVGVLDTAEQIARLVAALGQDRWRTIVSRTTLTPEGRFLELLERSCSKGAALADLCAVYGIDRSEVVAIGDNVNDLEMLEYAGLAVAMGNAPPEVQAVADWVTASNAEDGVALAIYRLFAGRL
jgi:Cof subfamily protein (haloacid dehalogenase superfamily)